MTVGEGLTAIGVLVAFAFLIISQIRKKNPQALDWLTKWFGGNPKPINLEESKDKMEQIYQGKRWGM
jgi:hypothetical protein